MRDDDDPIRQYVPMLRRLIILMVMLTAIPVVWTIATSVRAYVGPRHWTNLRPLADTIDTANATPQTTASRTDRIATADRNASASVATKSNPADADTPAPQDGATTATPNTGPNATADVASGAVFTQPPASPPEEETDRVATTTAPSGPSTAPSGPPPFAAGPPADVVTPNRPSAPVWPATSAAVQSPAQPMTGMVPLPHKRPRTFRTALSSVPLPRARPETPADAPSEPPHSPLNWFQHIFHPGVGASTTAADSGSDAEPLSR